MKLWQKKCDLDTLAETKREKGTLCVKIIFKKRNYRYRVRVQHCVALSSHRKIRERRMEGREAKEESNGLLI